jgi:hypothetical protein
MYFIFSIRILEIDNLERERVREREREREREKESQID